MIRVEHLAKRYGGIVALKDMNLSVGQGTIHAVVGESGAGKSTLVKVLAGVVRPDAGIVRIGDQTVTIDSSTTARKHGFGVVYQDLSLASISLWRSRESTPGLFQRAFSDLLAGL